MKNILIVEDDPKIAKFVQLELNHEGYETTVEHDGRSGLNRAFSVEFDAVILDIMLPFLSGTEVLRRIRKESDVPVIMLTAKDDISDKVMGLDLGADDYITKPFAIEELLARLRVVLKRTKKGVSELTVGLLRVDERSRSVFYSNAEIELTKKEYELLLYLLKNKGQALNRELLLTKVWGYDYVGETNILDVYISYLRNKIDHRFNISLIETVRGIGYIIKDKTDE
ncbi:response regulator transcription factor [Mycoplasmatota bacterium zrk1]